LVAAAQGVMGLGEIRIQRERGLELTYAFVRPAEHRQGVAASAQGLDEPRLQRQRRRQRQPAKRLVAFGRRFAPRALPRLLCALGEVVASGDGP